MVVAGVLRRGLSSRLALLAASLLTGKVIRWAYQHRWCCWGGNTLSISERMLDFKPYDGSIEQRDGSDGHHCLAHLLVPELGVKKTFHSRKIDRLNSIVLVVEVDEVVQATSECFPLPEFPYRVARICL